MAPVEQLRHQPWRRARPSAILAPSSRTPPPTPAPQDPAFGATRGARTALGPRTVGQNKCHQSLSPLRPGRTGPAGDARLGGGSSARREGSSGPGRSSSAVLRGQAAKRRGRGRPAGRHAPRTGPGRAGSRPRALPLRCPTQLSSPRPPAEAAGKEETGMKPKPGPRRRLLPHPFPSPSRDAGSILPRRKKMRFTPKSFQERKETGGRGKQRGGDWKS